MADRAGDESLAQKDRPVLQKHVSFETMTRRWTRLAQLQLKEQRQATDLFSLIIRTYANKFTPGEHPAISYRTAADLGSGRVDVPTPPWFTRQPLQRHLPHRADFRRWRITDVSSRASARLHELRSQLDAQFKRGGAFVISSSNQSVSVPEGKRTCSASSPSRPCSVACATTARKSSQPAATAGRQRVTPVADEVEDNTPSRRGGRSLEKLNRGMFRISRRPHPFSSGPSQGRIRCRVPSARAWTTRL
ncbi:MAG: hypothetical protein R3F13_02390 [Prosthecobacter sp.]